ncbi:hypothetical protein [Neobacillus sp. LXY-1]|uniref:hypothetical protein n=1 Tax=Neobacillus sp. LXY-1 TaxID=3379133 RepID=UPI003EDFB601
MAVGAAKNDSRVDNSIQQEDKLKCSSNVSKTKSTATMNSHKGEVEIEYGKTIIKNKNKGRIDDGRHHERHSGNDDSKRGDGKHQKRHSGDDDRLVEKSMKPRSMLLRTGLFPISK